MLGVSVHSSITGHTTEQRQSTKHEWEMCTMCAAGREIGGEAEMRERREMQQREIADREEGKEMGERGENEMRERWERKKKTCRKGEDDDAMKYRKIEI